jgi:hypothetical protein
MATEPQTEPPPAHSRPGMLLFWSALAAAALAVTAAALVSRFGPHPAPYRRYVSPPLPDGTRFTFRYPASLGSPHVTTTHPVTQGGRLFVLDVTVSRPPDPRRRYPFLRPLFPANDPEEVQMSIADDPLPGARPTPHSAGTVTKAAGSPPDRFVRSSTEEGEESYGSHEVDLRNFRTDVECELVHMYLGPGARQGFDRHDAAIASSFQALPPGTPVPVP